jgi:DNA repair photolyase
MQPPLRMSGMANPSIPGQLREVVQAAREAGAAGIWTNLLFLRPGTREHFLEHLAPDWPELLPHSRQLYRGRAYLGAEETKPIRRQVSALAREFGVADRRSTRIEPERETEQLTLEV